eukprot:12996474-Alexandrium_andersonii.AAC.1
MAARKGPGETAPEGSKAGASFPSRDEMAATLNAPGAHGSCIPDDAACRPRQLLTRVNVTATTHSLLCASGAKSNA